MSEPAVNESELIAGLQKGAAASWTVLYNDMKVRLYGFTKKLVADPFEAKDIVADVFQNCWRLRKNFETLSDYHSYLYVSCRNRSYDYLRSQSMKQKHEQSIQSSLYVEEDENITPQVHAEMIRAEVRDALYKAVKELPPQTSKIFELLYFEEMSVQEIADTLHINPQTVRNLKTRGLQSLREKFSDHDIAFAIALVLCDHYFLK